jgi:hypothetical protein
MRGFWMTVLVACCTPACHERPSNDECLELIDRYTEKLLRANDPDLPESEVVRLQREARVRAEDDPQLLRCRRDVSRHEYECAMQAPTVDAMEKCLLP